MEEHEKHEDAVAELHHSYHRYKLGFRGWKKQPLDYQDWLEHTAVRLAAKLGDLEEKQQVVGNRESVNALLDNLRSAALRGNLQEVLQLLMVWAAWN